MTALVQKENKYEILCIKKIFIKIPRKYRFRLNACEELYIMPMLFKWISIEYKTSLFIAHKVNYIKYQC